MIGKGRFIIVHIVLGITILFVIFCSNIIGLKNRTFSQFPTRVNGWHMTSQTVFSEEVLNILKPTDYLSRQYASEDGRVVDLYLGYHDGINERSGIHSPKHCLSGSGWTKIQAEKTVIQTDNGSINFVKSVYQKGEEKELFLYWFIVQGRSLSDEYSLVLAEIINYITNQRKDSAFVRISIPFESNEEKATELGIQFIRDFSPVIQGFIPHK